MPNQYDAVIIGSGANGLAAATYLQQKGLQTAIYEQASKPGGATRTEELTLPDFHHDVGSAIHPLAYASPFFSTLPLEEHGLQWVFPDIPYAHPFAGGTAFACYKDIDLTARQLGEDEASYRRLFSSLTQDWDKIDTTILAPLRWPAHPLKLASFGLKALLSARAFANLNFKQANTKTFFYGAAAHSTLPLTTPASASFGIVLAVLAHRFGWPFPKQGAVKITEALLAHYQSLGGTLYLNHNVTHLEELPSAKAYLFDLTPQQLLNIKGTKFSSLYRRRLEAYKYGAGVFKIDWALSAPIPFRDQKCRRAGTVHLGYTPEEIEQSEKGTYEGLASDRPYVLLAQHSVFDDARAPAGKHTAWAYCHVPNGNTLDRTEAIENQVERAAPGFKDCILARSTKNTQQMEAFDPNLVGGDINGGKQDLTQMFTRPVMRLSPYTTSDDSVYICSSSTPPGGGVHGMCGYNAARQVLKDHFKELT